MADDSNLTAQPPSPFPSPLPPSIAPSSTHLPFPTPLCAMPPSPPCLLPPSSDLPLSSHPGGHVNPCFPSQPEATGDPAVSQDSFNPLISSNPPVSRDLAGLPDSQTSSGPTANTFPPHPTPTYAPQAPQRNSDTEEVDEDVSHRSQSSESQPDVNPTGISLQDIDLQDMNAPDIIESPLKTVVSNSNPSCNPKVYNNGGFLNDNRDHDFKNDSNNNENEKECPQKIAGQDSSPEEEGGEKQAGAPTSWRDEFRINKKLLPIKIAMFCFHGGSFAFLPFTTLHMQQLGLSTAEIASTYAVLPLPSIAGPMLSGVLADRLNAFKQVFLCNVLLMMLLHTLLLYVPPAPDGVELRLRCDAGGAAVRWAPPTTGGEGGDDQEFADYRVVVKDCRLADCPATPQPSASPSTVQWCFNASDAAVCETVPISHKWRLALHVGQDAGWAAGVGRAADGRYHVQAAEPTLANLSREGVRYDGLSCPGACAVECGTEGLLDLSLVPGAQFSTTFWVYLALRVPAQLFLASAFCMMDAVTMAVIARLGGDFGKQRLMSMVALGVMPLLASLLVTAVRAATGKTDYSAAFYFGDGLLLVAVAVTAALDLARPEASARSVFSDLRRLLARLDIVVLLAVIMLLGTNWGFLESFFFVFLSELNAPPYLLGLTLTFGCALGIPIMFLSDRIIAKVGRTNIFILSFFAYSVRMFGYSVITNPWHSFPLEALEVVTYQLMWVAAVTYFPLLAPPSLLATMSGVCGTLHYNGGRGIGSLLGGNLMAKIGSRNTFRVFGAMSLVGGVLYLGAVCCYLGPRARAKEQRKAMESKELQASKTEEAA